MNILTVMALPMEATEHFSDLDVVYSGVGKVNAAYSLTKCIIMERPDIIVNLGTAGGIAVKPGTVVCCTSFIQRDMSVTPLGFMPYQTPFEEKIILNNGLQIEGYSTVTCATGDSFVNVSHGRDGFDIVDMEAYALAKICLLEGIPFYCAKYISDNANETAAQDWQPSLDDGAQKLRQAYADILKSLP